MKLRIFTSVGDRTRSDAFFIIVSVSRTIITRSSLEPADNFMNVFTALVYILILSFITMPVGFNFNLTYGLKP